ncbi:MAG: dynamin family protein [Actinomycetes bacterium]
MAEFLDGFDIERDAVLNALAHFETVWDRFRERRGLELDDAAMSDSLIAGELALVRADLEEVGFTIGVFGLIKRGKSTLLNSLIGREVSAMHVTPETAVPVYVSYAEEPGAEVHLADGTVRHVAVEDTALYTSQKHNENNQLGVTHVEQRVPVGFLRNGTRLIDTPGLDDAEADEVYTERTLQELDVVDAGVVVFLSPPTVGATEMDFLEQVVSRGLKKSFLVCNMYPQHFHDPDTRNAVLEYVGRRIVEASRRGGHRGEVRIYPVCAQEAWQARLDDDVDGWKRSGADRLLRDMELFLAGVTGRGALEEAVERIEKAAEMASTEVDVRLRLLDDPAQLAAHRASLDGRVRALESEVDGVVARTLEGVGPLRLQLRGQLLAPFADARSAVARIQSAAELEEFSMRFRRRVEVAAEQASRQFAAGFEDVVRELRRGLEQELHAVVHDLVPTVPRLRLSTSSLLAQRDARDVRADAAGGVTERTGAIAGGLAGGAATALLAGVTLLSPLGLLGGALVGWKLSSVLSSSGNVERAKAALLEQLDQVARRLARDFDLQVEAAMDAVTSAVERRRRAFASDLYEQFDLVQGLGTDPGVLERQRREAQRFAEAFRACAARARAALPD